jgi:hypothetical protein
MTEAQSVSTELAQGGPNSRRRGPRPLLENR